MVKHLYLESRQTYVDHKNNVNVRRTLVNKSITVSPTKIDGLALL